jgi:hypothetical protein
MILHDAFRSLFYHQTGMMIGETTAWKVLIQLRNNSMEKIGNTELLSLEGGMWRQIAKELVKSKIISDAWDMLESACSDFADGWNSHEC